ncbi:hypothetical protein HanRHA438_Chr03g0131971 [Helianthus annuus]|nr:hypothetical protein HanRHA438_Chr03g0131971 [Helianthus annuus]
MTAMEAPCLPNCVEISKPMPEAPPVKRATLPFKISGLNGDSIVLSCPSRNQTKILINIEKKEPVNIFYFTREYISLFCL